MRSDCSKHLNPLRAPSRHAQRIVFPRWLAGSDGAFTIAYLDAALRDNE